MINIKSDQSIWERFILSLWHIIKIQMSSKMPYFLQLLVPVIHVCEKKVKCEKYG